MLLTPVCGSIVNAAVAVHNQSAVALDCATRLQDAFAQRKSYAARRIQPGRWDSAKQ
jgi:hypothetical protein